MAKKFSLRSVLMRYPVLDGLRLDFLAGFCHHGIGFMDHSYQVVKLMSPSARELLEGRLRRPAIIAIYHGRMVGMLGLHPRLKRTILISQSRDGEIIARAAHRLGFSVTRGSAARGGVQAVFGLVDAARQGQDILFTVDGPRGPAHKVKAGIIRLAEVSGMPIIPFVCSSRYNWWFNSWDRYMGPLWGSPIVYMLGEPIFVPADADETKREQLRLKLESRMNQMREHGDRLWGATPGKC